MPMENPTISEEERMKIFAESLLKEKHVLPIFKCIQWGASTVEEISCKLSLSVSVVRGNLRLMSEAGLISRVRNGNSHYRSYIYSLEGALNSYLGTRINSEPYEALDARKSKALQNQEMEMHRKILESILFQFLEASQQTDKQ